MVHAVFDTEFVICMALLRLSWNAMDYEKLTNQEYTLHQDAEMCDGRKFS